MRIMILLLSSFCKSIHMANQFIDSISTIYEQMIK